MNRTKIEQADPNPTTLKQALRMSGWETDKFDVDRRAFVAPLDVDRLSCVAPALIYGEDTALSLRKDTSSVNVTEASSVGIVIYAWEDLGEKHKEVKAVTVYEKDIPPSLLKDIGGINFMKDHPAVVIYAWEDRGKERGVEVAAKIVEILISKGVPIDETKMADEAAMKAFLETIY